MKIKTVISVVLRLIAAGIMLQTLYFKFTAQPESVYIFSKVGIEPWGRIGTGIAELTASVLLLIPSTIVVGAILAAGIMAGAITTHLLILGITVQGDGGLLFAYAVVTFMASLLLLLMYRDRLTQFNAKRFRNNSYQSN
jgi:predicted neutral ceramidase superfamily lipid hydrolase